MKTRSLLVAFLSILTTAIAGAQSPIRQGKIGLGLDGLTGSPNVVMKYFFNNQLAGQVIAGFDLDMPAGPAPTGTTEVTGLILRGGISVLFHLNPDQVSPFIGVEGVFQSRKDGGFVTPGAEADRKNSIAGGVVLGAEYFIHEQFSMGIKALFGLDVQLSRDTPREETGIRFGTTTVFTGRFYFN